MDDGHSISQWVGNGLGGAAIVTSLVGFLPAFAAMIALAWYLIQIYESKTVQHWLLMRRSRKLVRLKARVLMMEAQGKPPLQGPENGGAALHD